MAQNDPMPHTEPHIPAWKKLGLELKNTKADGSSRDHTPENSNEDNASGTTAHKRKALQMTTVNASSEPSEKVPKRKRRRISDDLDSLVLNGVTELNKCTKKPLPASPSKVEPPLRQRKSVSFSTEAKTKDGDSVKQYKKRRDAEIDQFASTAHETSADESIEGRLDKKKKKKKKKEAKQKASSICVDNKAHLHSTSQRTPSYLTYLIRYHTSLSNWKFSKNQQSHLLKHIFSPNELPSSYDPALVSYLRGLQSSDSRQRLREAACKVREEEDKWFCDPVPTDTISKDTRQSENMNGQSDPDRHRRQKEAYESEIRRMKTLLREKAYERENRIWEACGGKVAEEKRFQKRKRAELVLWSIGENQVRPKDVEHADQLQQQHQQRLNGLDSNIASNGWMLGRDAAKVSTNGGFQVGKKIVFDEEGAAAKTEHVTRSQLNGIGRNERPINGVQHRQTPARLTKRSRKRRAKKRTGVPDDDDSSSSSDSEAEGRTSKAPPEVKVMKQELKQELKSDSDTSDSDDGSNSSSTDDSDNSE